MKICLLRSDHTALLINDGIETITTEPATTGILEIEGRCFAIEQSGTVIKPQTDLIGRVRVVFTTVNGTRYVGERPRMVDGIPVSVLDYQAEYAKVRIKLDSIEQQVDQLAWEYHKLYNDNKHDALGFLTHNTKKTEVN